MDTPSFLHRLSWQRRDQPILSAMTTDQEWCRVTLYSPSVLRMGDRYKMWYLGNNTATRTITCDLGYAESEDGITWTPYSGNPILTRKDLPWGRMWQTPYVLYDAEEKLYRMWFIMVEGTPDGSGKEVSIGQQLGYATSVDGLRWDVHPEPIYPSGRRPCVVRDGSDAYRMWMCSSPDPDGNFGDLVGHIYRFESTDGIQWTRDPKPMLTAPASHQRVVYPFVILHEGAYTMWYSCHVNGGVTQLYCSTSTDGLTWTHHLEKPAFPTTRNPNDFDGRYVSTAFVLDDGDRYLLYYSARDWGNLYRAGDGTIQFDRAGIYRHIGVAICPKEERV